MYDMNSNDHDLDPLQKGCRNVLYILFSIMLIPISCLGGFYLLDRFILHLGPTYSGTWSLEKALFVGGAMVILPLLLYGWVRNKLFYRNQD